MTPEDREEVRRMIEGTRLYDQPDTRGRLIVAWLVPPPEPTDCPDPGPAKEAATPTSVPADSNVAPQHVTAPPAPFGGEDEVRAIINDAWRHDGMNTGVLYDRIRALVKQKEQTVAMKSFRIVEALPPAHRMRQEAVRLLESVGGSKPEGSQ